MRLFFFGRIFFLVDAKQMFARLGGSGTEGCRTCWAAETVPAWKEVPTDVSINRELDSTNFKESEIATREKTERKAQGTRNLTLSIWD